MKHLSMPLTLERRSEGSPNSPPSAINSTGTRHILLATVSPRFITGATNMLSALPKTLVRTSAFACRLTCHFYDENRPSGPCLSCSVSRPRGGMTEQAIHSVNDGFWAATVF
jgi:hypothetical protein